MNALVPNLIGAFKEGLSAAFRMFDVELDSEALDGAPGLTFDQAVRRVYAEHLAVPMPDEQRIFDLAEAYRKVVQRFIQFSSSMVTPPYFAETIERLKKAGHPLGLCTSLDQLTLAILMDRLGWNPSMLFDTYAVSEDGRTKAEILEVLIGRLPVSEGGEPVYLGAVPSDIEAAKQCGCGQIWLMVSPDHEEESEVESVDTVYSISKFSALIEGQSIDYQEDSGL